MQPTKSKTELTFEAFAVRGFNCTRETWEAYIKSKGIKSADQTLYYTVKKSIARIQELVKDAQSLGVIKQMLKDENLNFNETIYNKIANGAKTIAEARASRGKPVKPTKTEDEPKTLPKGTAGSTKPHGNNGATLAAWQRQPIAPINLGDMLKTYHKVTSLVDKHTDETIREIASVVADIGAAGIAEMLDAYKESKAVPAPQPVQGQ